MVRNRSRYETIYTVLKIALRQIKKTHIMYSANLSYHQLTRYLHVLLRKRLITKQGTYYVTTAQGRMFIEKFTEIQTLLRE
jgi:predicted transcriptional regulator